MIQIEAYSLDYDKSIQNSGMSRKVFVNHYVGSDCTGIECKSLAEALQGLSPDKLAELEILYCYRDGDEQRFIKFNKK